MRNDPFPFERLHFGAGIPVAIVASEGGVIEVVGEQEDLTSSGLYRQLFGGNDCIRSLSRSLEGQSCHGFGGRVIFLVGCKPRRDVIAGLFYRNKRDAIEQFD